MLMFSQPFLVSERICEILSPSIYSVSSYRLYIGAAAYADVKTSISARISDVSFFNLPKLLYIKVDFIIHHI